MSTTPENTDKSIESDRAITPTVEAAHTVENVSDDVAGAVEGATAILDPELLGRELTHLRNTSLDQIVQIADRDIAEINPAFLQSNGIDLSRIEDRLRAKYGEQWPVHAHGLKVWIPTLVGSLKQEGGNKRERQRDIARAVGRIKNILE